VSQQLVIAIHDEGDDQSLRQWPLQGCDCTHHLVSSKVLLWSFLAIS
jgi:hypothetical protein